MGRLAGCFFELTYNIQIVDSRANRSISFLNEPNGSSTGNNKNADEKISAALSGVIADLMDRRKAFTKKVRYEII